jgi:hypothetical protein
MVAGLVFFSVYFTLSRVSAHLDRRLGRAVA